MSNDESGDVLRLAMDAQFALVLKTIENSPQLNLDAKDGDGRTLLHWACVYGHLGTVEVLLSRKVKVNTEDDSEYTPLASAIAAGHLRIVELLIGAGADANVLCGASNVSVLHLIKESGALCEYLCKHLLLLKNANNNSSSNAVLNLQDRRGNSPLHRAVARQTTAVAKQLLHHGANVNARNKHGDTPLHVAALERNADMIQLLLNGGADRTRANNDGQVPELL